MYQLIFYVPSSHLESVKQAIFDAGGGHLGHYDQCCWQIAGTGQFRPLAGSEPYIGSKLQLHHLTEYKVEMICERNRIHQAVQALLSSHPYQQPAYQILPCLSLNEIA